MSTIDAILRDAEEQERLHHGCPSYGERDRLERLKEALYQADDLFDEVTTRAHLKKLMPGSKLSKEVSLFFSQFNQLRSAVTRYLEIKNIRVRLDDVVKDHQLAGGFRHSVVLEDSRVRNNPRETHSYVNLENDVIIGRDNDKRVLIDMLLDDTTVEGNVSVVTIVGIGGLGKTTLAQLVYNDDRIVKEFPLKMWVCVSDDFNVKVLAAQILAAATKQAYQNDGLTMDRLQEKLREVLDRKKYLLVLDDVWNENSEEWQKMRTLLVGGGRGSRVLVTSRSKKVADVVGSCKTHELKGLSDDESFGLFQKMALKPEEYPMKPQLVDTGKEVVRKCANVPLAIRVVGSLLRGQGESKWENLKNTDLTNIIQDGEAAKSIVPVLKISYYYLPFHLKRCFSYSAVFPKDYQIVKEDVIRLWMAQGFIMPSNGESFEDAGEEYFMQLLQRCFFQDVQLAKGTANEIVSCKMHDLIHDLAKEVAGTDILSCTYSARCFNEKTRHVYLDTSTPEDLLGELTNMQRIRTFLCIDDRKLPFSIESLVVEVSKMKYLRVLRLNNLGLELLPSLVGELVHLRYLDLSGNSLHVLPSSISKLYNLQTLKLRLCRNLKRLPRELRKLVNLRYLDISGCRSLTHMPPGMNNMTSLQKLPIFVVSGSGRSNAGWNWRSTGVGQLEDLDNFTNYSSSMKIIVKKDVRYDAVVGGGMLLKNQKLREIMYKWETGENDNAKELLQGLQPHPNLRKLELWNYPGLRFPTWMMTLSCCLPKLVQIEIISNDWMEHLPLMSQLRHLKVLTLSDLSEVEYVESSSNINGGDEDDELVFFPSLEKLLLRGLPKLKGWWKTRSESGKNETPQAKIKSFLPNVVEIEIFDCSRLVHFPLMSQLRHLKVLKLYELGEAEYLYMESGSNINGGDEDDELVFFPSLEKIELWNLPKLKGWWKSESRMGETPQAPMLSHLYIYNCPNLTTFPFCPELQQLHLFKFNEAVGPMMRETTQQKEEGRYGRLREVKIDNVAYLNSLPIHHLFQLQIMFNDKIERLKIGEVGEVFRSGRLSSLPSLQICKCSKLKSISGRGVWEHFTALETLKLEDLPELELEDEDDVSNSNMESTGEGCINNEGSDDAEMPWRYLAPTLRSLILCELPKVVKLPKGIGCLSSLQSLFIMNCQKLKTMPEEMRHLTSLTKLVISTCSLELMTECKNKNGANWSNIQHIPNINTDY